MFVQLEMPRPRYPSSVALTPVLVKSGFIVYLNMTLSPVCGWAEEFCGDGPFLACLLFALFGTDNYLAIFLSTLFTVMNCPRWVVFFLTL